MASNTRAKENQKPGPKPDTPPKPQGYSTAQEIKELKASVLNIEKLTQSFDSRLQALEKSVQKDLKAQSGTLKATIDEEVAIVIARIARLEDELQNLRGELSAKQEFDPDSTLIAQGIPVTADQDILEEAKKLVHDVLNEPDVQVARAIRLPSRNDKPGIVKIQVKDTDTKVRVLRKKSLLGETEGYKNIYLRSSKSHVERLLELNILKLLNEIPNGRQRYRLTANGRLIEKTQNAGGEPNGRGDVGGRGGRGGAGGRGGRGGLGGGRGGGRGGYAQQDRQQTR